MTLPTKNPDAMDWTDSKDPRAVGCASKKLWAYADAPNLGGVGAASDYTTLYRFQPRCKYPTWVVVEGAVEICVVKGILDVSGTAVPAGRWVQLGQQKEGWSIGSVDDIGCEILAICRGRIEQLGDKS